MTTTPPSTPPFVAPDDQSATFVELFFDLVFVFSVTQVVGLLHDGFTWVAVGQGVLVFWLVWWGWSQYTWALNAANTDHPWVRFGTLAATAVAFFMAIALPDAFQERALWFAAAYVLVRIIGSSLYVWVLWGESEQRPGVRVFTAVSVAGFVAVLVGAVLGGAAQYWLWGLTIVLDLVAAGAAGQTEGWNLHPEHFSERHGLFVIIALGETLIVAGSGLTGETWSGGLFAIAVLSVAIACGLWWSYFSWAKDALEHGLAKLTGAAQARLARDAFSLVHFAMLFGVIAFAFAVEEVVAHPGNPLPFAGRLALALGLVLFVGGMAVAVWRARGRLPLPRVVVIALAVAAILVLSGVSPIVTLGVALVGVLLVAVLERGPLLLPEE